MKRRRWPVMIMVIGVLVLLGWYIGYTRHVVSQLRGAAAMQGRMYARIYEALQDTSVDADPAVVLLDLSQEIRESGLPLVVTDRLGRVTGTANIPRDIERDTARLRQFIVELDQKNPPIADRAIGAVHLGDNGIVTGLQVIPLLQAFGIVLLVGFGVYALIERGRAEREKVWAGMAREAAHQLGTPLSALAGWIELLGETVSGGTATRAVDAMGQDLQRLERVSHRFERIGRPPRDEKVDCNALVDRLASYFAARAPTLARTVRIRSEHPTEPVVTHGDQVLLEWVLEVLIKNAIDALGGRNGEVVVSARPLPEGGVRIRVEDDGPGVPRKLRKRIFDAGFSTKDRGWGIGLSLARRIVEENHDGKLVLADTDRGAAFDIILRG
ncbi:MAG TPA: sensor histidine kinase [Gemmatimonas aurantiaca]|uniref:histidine kinase n=2 Tax=Gemmatimonas aurantiaca TaxID=173480 RepID=C1A8M6_GEMAT|nr:HAMP domain-containing sensor histidine kinase [Gemmatimonas aurantiaca]BAH38586.1 two-component histidine kinase [Gemmatimonas aurantiaca T-27]HCT57291.1 sensor histidine kinase [Gemmatimonas aurantiaca]